MGGGFLFVRFFHISSNKYIFATKMHERNIKLDFPG